MFELIAGGGLSGFVPHLVDGADMLRKRRSHDGARGINDHQPIIAVHDRPNCCVGLLGGVSAVWT
jgi:hypothetical protein